jgi:hypothetical protein
MLFRRISDYLVSMRKEEPFGGRTVFFSFYEKYTLLPGGSVVADRAKAQE